MTPGAHPTDSWAGAMRDALAEARTAMATGDVPVGAVVVHAGEVIGAGHNGLTAAAYLADAGRSVLVLEKADHIGGAAVSADSTSIFSKISFTFKHPFSRRV